MIKEWEEICKNKSWNDDNRYKPRIVDLIESFENQFPDTDSRERTACLAVVMYLFGPIEDEEEVELYLGIVKRRLRDYINLPRQ
jgi:hypothetical protein